MRKDTANSGPFEHHSVWPHVAVHDVGPRQPHDVVPGGGGRADVAVHLGLVALVVPLRGRRADHDADQHGQRHRRWPCHYGRGPAGPGCVPTVLRQPEDARIYFAGVRFVGVEIQRLPPILPPISHLRVFWNLFDSRRPC